MRFRSFLACAAAAPILIGAAEPVRLPPASTWVLDYAEDSCRLSRTFGSKADPTILLFESASPGNMSMLAIGDALKTSAGRTEVPARFLPDDQWIKGQSAKSSDGKKPAALWSSVHVTSASVAAESEALAKAQARAKRGERPPPINVALVAALRAKQLAFAGTVTGIEIEARRNRPVVLETGSLGRAMTMLEQCTRDQLRYWGVDPNIEDKIVRRAWAPAPHRWFDSADYPRASVYRGEQSIVDFRLLVDATGKPTKCTTLSHVDAPEFQKIVCNILMTRARLEPAELADGTRVPSYYANRVHWRVQ